MSEPRPDRRRRLVFLDTETTGLNKTMAQIIELAWGIEQEPIRAFILPHSLRNAEAKALEINRYWQRGLDHQPRDPHALDQFTQIAAGNIMVGANIHYDLDLLARAIGFEPWWHRAIDIEVYAQAVFGLDEPPGLRIIRELLVERGYDVPEPDHTAIGDTLTVRACYYLLNGIARARTATADWPAVEMPVLA
jgi:DNA polymerase III alpha subunit (gram-positive type)